jgi:predicted secreted protein
MKRISIAIMLALALMTALATSASDAMAGDGAALHVLGFSTNGRYFAFEQYGEQDGSGTLFSTITAIEIAGDRPVKGAPIAVFMSPDHPDLGKEPRDQLLATIRARAATNAAAMLRRLDISEASQQIASAADGRTRSVLPADQVKSVMQAAVGSLPLPAERFGTDARLVLREFDIAMQRCKHQGTGEHPVGFGLTLERRGRPTIHLSRDQTIPAARGCPERYGIVEAHALPLPDGSLALAVVIQYFYPGFEGPDRRFMAVTSRVR